MNCKEAIACINGDLLPIGPLKTNFNFYPNSNIFIQENAFKEMGCKMTANAAILFILFNIIDSCGCFIVCHPQEGCCLKCWLWKLYIWAGTYEVL